MGWNDDPEVVESAPISSQQTPTPEPPEAIASVEPTDAYSAKQPVGVNSPWDKDPIVGSPASSGEQKKNSWESDPVIEESKQEHQDPYAMAARRELSEAWSPEARSMERQVTGFFMAPIQRLAGGLLGDADVTNRVTSAFEEQAPHQGVVAKGLRGAITNYPSMALSGAVGGPTGMIAQAVGQTMDQAVTSGRDAGLSGVKLGAHVAAQGAIMGTVQGFAQRAGLGGMKKFFGGDTAERVAEASVSAVLKRFGMTSAEQLGQGFATVLASNAEKYAAGVDRDAMTPKRLGQDMAAIAVQTLVQTGALSGAELARGHIGGVVDRAKELVGSGEHVSRKEFAAMGLEGGRTAKERDAIVRQLVESQKPALAKGIPEQYNIPQEWVDSVWEQAKALKMPTGENLETLYPGDDDKPAVMGEHLGDINGRRFMSTDLEAANRRLTKDPSKRDLNMGSNHHVDDFVPADQVWGSGQLSEKELPKIAAHETIEEYLLEHNPGMKYDEPSPGHPIPAHKIANEIEWGKADESIDGNVHYAKTPDYKGEPGEPTPEPSVEPKRTPTGKISNAIEPASKIVSTLKDALAIVAPAAKSEEARTYAYLARRRGAEATQMDVASRNALRGLDDEMFKITPEERHELCLNVDEGTVNANPRLEAIRQALYEQNVRDRELIQSLGTGKLDEFYENYLSHRFKQRPENDAVLGKLLQKTQRKAGWLKKRKYPTLREAEAAGLELMTDNPVELNLITSGQMHEYWAKTKVFQDQIRMGQAVFVPANHDKDMMPNGYRFVNDPMYMVQTREGVTVQEVSDRLANDQVEAVSANIGVPTERLTKMPKGTLGMATLGEKPSIKTKFGSGLATKFHELGHQIGDMFDLTNFVMKDDHTDIGVTATPSELDAEWGKLAKLRYESLNATDEYRNYVQDPKEREAVMLEAWWSAPEKMEAVAPNLTKIWRQFLDTNEPVRPLLNIDRSLVMQSSEGQVPVPGIQVLGRWAFPNDVSDMIDNHLSLGLRANSNEAVKGGYNMVRMWGNAQNQFNMSMSLFHGIHSATEAVASQAGLGVQQAFRGEVAKGLKTLAKSPSAPWTLAKIGGEYKRAMGEYLDRIEDPRIRQQLEDVFKAGGRSEMDPFYSNQSYRAMRDSFYDFKNSEDWSKVPAAVRTGVHGIFSALEATSIPVMQAYVPRLKLGVFSMLAKDINERAHSQGLSERQRTEQLTQAWDSVENRLGQMCYDNLFWNQYLKDVSQLAVRSVGWNLGDIREFGGAFTDIFSTKARKTRGGENLSGKMAYAIGAAITYGTMGTVTQYLMGDRPRELKDAFFPRTGRQLPDGSDERIALQNYSKDWAAFYMQPGKTLAHKLHPMWGTALDVWNNEDFYGTKIRNEDDPWFKQFIDTSKYLAESFSPFSYRNFAKMREANEPMWKASVMAVSGATAAPSYLTQSPAMQAANKHMSDNSPKGTRTSEQAATAKKKAGFTKKLRAHEEITPEDYEGLKASDIKSASEASSLTPLQAKVKRLTFAQGYDVWSKANKREREDLLPILARKHNTAKEPSDTDLALWEKMMSDLHGQSQ